MYKDGTGINIDELGKFPTDAKNGLSVQVTLQMNHDKVQELIEGFRSLAFFNCVYLDDSQKLLLDFVEHFNNRKSVYLNSFAVWNMEDYNLKRNRYSNTNSVNIVVGNCIYPLTKRQLCDKSNLPAELPIYLRFNIGEIDVTPNRETILYNPKTDAAILKKAEKAVEELKALITKQNCLDFSSLLEWYLYKKDDKITVPVPLSKDEVYKINIKNNTIRDWKLPEFYTIKGKSMPTGPLFTIMDNLLERYVPHDIIKFRFDQSNQMFYSKMTSGSFKLISLIRKSKAITTDDVVWKTILKDYLKDEYYSKKPQTCETYYILKRSKGASVLRKYLKELLKLDTSPNHTCTRFILKELDFSTLFPNYNSTDIPADYITKWEARKKAIKASAVTNKPSTEARKCVIYTLGKSQKYDYSISDYGIVSDNKAYTIDTISKSGKLFVYTYNDNINDLKSAYVIFSRILDLKESIEFIYVTPTNIPTLAALSNTVELYSYLYTRKNGDISSFVALDLDKVKMLQSVSYNVWDKIVMEFPELYDKIIEYRKYYSSIINLKFVINEVQGLLNKIIKKYKENKWVNLRVKELQSDESMFAFIQWSEYINFDKYSLEIFADYIYRSNLSKMTPKAYNAYKNSIFYKSFIKL